MPSTGNHTFDLILLAVAAALLLFLGYRLGRLLGALAANKALASEPGSSCWPAFVSNDACTMIGPRRDASRIARAIASSD
jgi:hypothetical protein